MIDWYLSISFWTGCSTLTPACVHCHMRKSGGTWGVIKHYPKQRARKYLQKAIAISRALRPAQLPAVAKLQWRGDSFHPDIPTEWIDELYELTEKTPNLIWLSTTRNSSRLLAESRRRPIPKNWKVGFAAGDQDSFNRQWHYYRQVELPHPWWEYRPQVSYVTLPPDAANRLTWICDGWWAAIPFKDQLKSQQIQEFAKQCKDYQIPRLTITTEGAPFWRGKNKKHHVARGLEKPEWMIPKANLLPKRLIQAGELPRSYTFNVWNARNLLGRSVPVGEYAGATGKSHPILVMIRSDLYPHQARELLQRAFAAVQQSYPDQELPFDQNLWIAQQADIFGPEAALDLDDYLRKRGRPRLSRETLASILRNTPHLRADQRDQNGG